MILNVPAFARLGDYVGLWSMEPTAWNTLTSAVTRLDFATHEGPGEIQSAIELVPTASGQQVAVIKAQGVLMKSQTSMGGTSTVQLRRDVRNAAADPNVAAILLAIDSPGGTSAGTYDLAADVRAATKQKPVWAHIDDLGASAAYWIASQATRITANSPNALIGSIGTFQVIYDFSKAAENQGIKTLLFATGPLKGAGIQGTSVTEEHAAYFQQLVNATQAEFDSAVRQGRGLSAKQLADVRHGGVMPATQAQSMGLIDAVQPLAKTLQEITQKDKSKGAARTAAPGFPAR